RLNVVTVRIPPLRERREDIPELTDFFLERFSRELGIEKPILTDRALEALRSHAWPGNVRELEHCIHRAIIFSEGYPIQASDIREALEEMPGGSSARRPVTTGEPAMLTELVREHLRGRGGAAHAFGDFIDEAERALLNEALRLTKGNQSAAAQLLGLPRPTL